VLFRDLIDAQNHIALVKGDVSQVDAPFVRVHVADPLRDLMMAVKEKSSGWNLSKSLSFLGNHTEPGVILLLGDSFESHNIEDLVDSFFSGRQPLRPTTGDGTGIYRTIGTGSQILRDLGLTKMRLLSSPMRFNALSGFDLEIVEYVESDAAE